jgi:hypothetical protein
MWRTVLASEVEIQYAKSAEAGQKQVRLRTKKQRMYKSLKKALTKQCASRTAKSEQILTSWETSELKSKSAKEDDFEQERQQKSKLSTQEFSTQIQQRRSQLEEAETRFNSLSSTYEEATQDSGNTVQTLSNRDVLLVSNSKTSKARAYLKFGLGGKVGYSGAVVRAELKLFKIAGNQGPFTVVTSSCQWNAFMFTWATSESIERGITHELGSGTFPAENGKWIKVSLDHKKLELARMISSPFVCICIKSTGDPTKIDGDGNLVVNTISLGSGASLHRPVLSVRATSGPVRVVVPEPYTESPEEEAMELAIAVQRNKTVVAVTKAVRNEISMRTTDKADFDVRVRYLVSLRMSQWRQGGLHAQSNASDSSGQTSQIGYHNVWGAMKSLAKVIAERRSRDRLLSAVTHQLRPRFELMATTKAATLVKTNLSQQLSNEMRVQIPKERQQKLREYRTNMNANLAKRITAANEAYPAISKAEMDDLIKVKITSDAKQEMFEIEKAIMSDSMDENMRADALMKRKFLTRILPEVYSDAIRAATSTYTQQFQDAAYAMVEKQLPSTDQEEWNFIHERIQDALGSKVSNLEKWVANHELKNLTQATCMQPFCNSVDLTVQKLRMPNLRITKTINPSNLSEQLEVITDSSQCDSGPTLPIRLEP